MNCVTGSLFWLLEDQFKIGCVHSYCLLLIRPKLLKLLENAGHGVVNDTSKTSEVDVNKTGEIAAKTTICVLEVEQISENLYISKITTLKKFKN